MFDMIGVDGKAITAYLMQYDGAEDDATRIEALQGALFSASLDDATRIEALQGALFSASRMLLVTRAIEPKSDEHVYESFVQHFIKTELIPERFTDVVLAGKAKHGEEILTRAEEVRALGDAVNKLYKTMDDSLRFKAAPVVPKASDFLQSLPV